MTAPAARHAALVREIEFFFFQAEDGIRDFCLSRGLGDVYKRQAALQTASGTGAQSIAAACAAAWDELKGLQNVAGTSQDCTKLPVVVTQTTLCTQGTVKPP